MNYTLVSGLGLGAVILLYSRLIWKGLVTEQLERPVITDKRRLLKIKLKSLAQESRIIRKEELRLRAVKHSALREEIYLHRVHDVRDETRATLLAYAFIRGKTYRSVEAHRSPTPKWAGIVLRAATMVGKYGTPDMKKAPVDILKTWIEAQVIPVLEEVAA